MRHLLYPVGTKTVACMLLLSSFFCFSCSSEEDPVVPEVPEVQYAQVTISLGTADNATPAFTKAETGDVHDIVNDNAADEVYERYIKDWWVVILDQQNKVYRVLSNTKNDTWEATSNTDDNEHQVGVDLVIGETYSFYAFANLYNVTDGGNLVQRINALETSNDFATFRQTAVSLLELAQYSSAENGKAIPMSSYVGTKTVDADPSQNKVTLELIRLLGKVSLEITNATGSDVTVNKLTMGKFRTSGSIYLFPYDAINQDPQKPNLLVKKNEESLLNPSFPETGTSSDWVYEPQTTLTIPKSADDEQNKQMISFYINETSQADQGNNGEDMKVSMDITGEGIERDNSPKSTQFFFIRRNDWIKVPLLISNAETEISCSQQHMPIGGIPDAVTFNPGLTINNRTLTTDHAGEITISYKLKTVNNQTDWTLQYYTNGATTSTSQYCYAIKVSDDATTPFLLEPTEQDNLTWWIGKPYEYGFVLYPGEANTGSFTVTAQELSYQGEAKIKLNLVATRTTTGGQTQMIVLPYTLTITNGKEQKGGNS